MPDIIFSEGKILAKRGKPTEEIHVNQKINFIFMKKISCLFVFLTCHICPFVLKLQGKVKNKQQSQQSHTCI